MFEIKVNIEATAPDLSEAITQLALAIKGSALVADSNSAEMVIPAGTPMDVMEAVPVAPQPITPAPAPAPIPVAPVPQPNPAPAMNPPQPAAPIPAPVQEAPKIDMNAISRAGAGLIDQGKMQDVLAVLGKYGVQVITQLREDQFEAFAADLRALGAVI